MKINIKILLLTLYIILNYSFICNSQNLVPNPSFEDYCSCPNDLHQFDSVLNWSSYQYYLYPFTFTPDYYNICATSSSGVSIPDNIYGYQNAYSGDGYAGFCTYLYDYPLYPYFYHEVIYAQLNEPMQIGTRYYTSFKVSLIDGLGLCASNNLGVLFTTYSGTSISVFNNFAHIYSDIIINDTASWVNIYGSFIADSAYIYIYREFFSRYIN